MTSAPFHTLVDLLRSRASESEGEAFLWLDRQGKVDAEWSWRELDQRAKGIAVSLREAARESGVAVQSDETIRVLLLYPPGLDFLATFFGCLYAGMVAIPAYPPGVGRDQARIRAIVDDARPHLMATTAGVWEAHRARGERESLPGAEDRAWLVCDDSQAPAERAAEWVPPELSGETLAFLQYTSGSTASPKGVMVRHGNALANAEMAQRAFGHSASSTFVGWLPHFHDMGLVGNILQPLFIGARAVLMSPMTVMQRPRRWLEAIDRFEAHTSGGPNFAYDLCVRKISEDAREGLDLSRWRLAFNGSEPIRYSTLDAFSRAFAPCGFRRTSFYPCYGLAEATLFVTGGSKEEMAVDGRFDRQALAGHVGRRVDGQEGANLVSSGRSASPQSLRVVDPDTGVCLPPGEVGEIWIGGPHIAAGYWNRPEESARVFGARVEGGDGVFLRTGDLGFLDGEELFVTGRLKDLLIVHGRNFYPQDIEASAARAHPCLRPGRTAAFAVEGSAGEEVVVIQGVERRASEEERLEAVHRLRQLVAEDHGLSVGTIVLVAVGAVPMTSSGKVRRSEARRAFLEGRFEELLRWSRPASEEIGSTSFAEAEEPIGREGWLALTRGERRNLARDVLARSIRRAALLPPEVELAGEPLPGLGLDSVALAQVAAEVEERCGGVLLPMAAAVGGRTIEALTEEIVVRLETPPQEDVESAGDPGALSYGQRSLWLLQGLDPASMAYTIAYAARVEGTLDREALRDAFQDAVDRHPLLRSTFPARGGEPCRVVAPEGRPSWDEVPVEGGEHELRTAVEAAAHRPLALATGPLLRLTLLVPQGSDPVLLLVIHHIIADLGSLATLLQEVASSYELRRRCRAVPSSSPPGRFEEHVEAERRALAGERGERLRRYWHRRLASLPDPLELPLDRSRPAQQSLRGGRFGFEVSPDVAEGVAGLARRWGVTRYAFLLAAFQLLLHRLTGARDFLVGTPTAGQHRAPSRGVMGYFVNPITIRARVEESSPLEDFFTSVGRDAARDLEHRDYPFPLLVEELRPERDPSRNPLFQVLFTLQKAPWLHDEGLTSFAVDHPGALLDLGSLKLRSFPVERNFSQFDLDLALGEVEGALTGLVLYRSDLFDRVTVERWAGSYQTLLGSLCRSEAHLLRDLEVLTPSEREQLLHEWNQPRGRVLERPACLHEWILAEAHRAPRAAACIQGEDVLSYGDLDRRSAGVARQLREAGVQWLGIRTGEGADFVVAMLAALRAGCAFVPLDPKDPEERFAFVVEDAGLHGLAVRSGEGANIAEALRSRGLEPMILEMGGALPAETSAAADAPVDPEAPAYAIYTSGTTGRPKAVVLTHAQVTPLMAWMETEYHLGSNTRLLQNLSFCFDFGLLEIFSALPFGGTLLFEERTLLARPEEYLETVARRRANTLYLTPSFAEQLVRQGRPLESVRLVLLGGEALGWPLVQALAALLPAGSRIYNGYGPTEAAINCAMYRVDVGEGGQVSATPAGGVPIGVPSGESRLYLAGSDETDLPFGRGEELWIGGPGVASGYLGRPALTAEKFIPDPFAVEPGQRLYRSGDRARFRHWPGDEPVLEYLGRLDDQVKVRGFRVEPAEVEAVLRRHPALANVAVVVQPDEAGGRLVACYVPGEDAAAEVGSEEQGLEEQLRSLAAEALAPHMVPSVFLGLDQLPLTANGKLDVKALPDRVQRPTLAGAFVTPGTPLEERIAAIWQRLLGVESVGVHDNFFDLGGHSLMIAQAHAQLVEETGRDFPVARMFEHPNIRSLARFLDPRPSRAEADPRNSDERARRQREALARQLRRHRRVSG